MVKKTITKKQTSTASLLKTFLLKLPPATFYLVNGVSYPMTVVFVE